MRFYKKLAKDLQLQTASEMVREYLLKMLVLKNYVTQFNFLQEKFRVFSNFHENNLCSLQVVSPDSSLVISKILHRLLHPIKHSNLNKLQIFRNR